MAAEQVLEMPSFLIGSVEQIVEQLYQRRELYGFSYYIVNDQHLQTFFRSSRTWRGNKRAALATCRVQWRTEQQSTSSPEERCGDKWEMGLPHCRGASPR
jgi:hypothetical protein